MTLLRLENIKKSYGDEKVLKGISFNLDKGVTKVVIGPSGTGKSTLLRCINQLTEPDGGEVYLNGERIGGGLEVDEARKQIGFVFQSFNLFKHLTALENVSIGLEKVLGLDEKEAKEKAYRKLEKVGLEEHGDKYPGQLSGGQKQRVGIARALGMDPTLILFDEPTSALDPELIGEVLEVMKDLADEGMTMLVVTHEIGFAKSVAQEIIFLEKGKIVEKGPPDQLINSPKKERTGEFLHKIEELYGK